MHSEIIDIETREKGLAIEYLKDVGEILGIQVRKIFYSKEEDWKSNDITIAKTIENSYYMDYLRKFLKEENFIYAKDMDETIEKVKRKYEDLILALVSSLEAVNQFND